MQHIVHSYIAHSAELKQNFLILQLHNTQCRIERKLPDSTPKSAKPIQMLNTPADNLQLKTNAEHSFQQSEEC